MAVIAGATVALAVIALVAWLVRGRIAAGDALVAVRREAFDQMTEQADLLNVANVALGQATADLAAVRAAHEADRATLIRTARELKAATQELTDAKRLEIHGASDADLAAAVLGVLQARVDADDARDRADSAARGGDGDAREGAAHVP